MNHLSKEDLKSAIISVRKIRQKALLNQRTFIEEPFCKICLDEGGDLVSPCICRGTQRWVHRSCLRRWRWQHDPFSPQFTRCMDCGSAYWDNSEEVQHAMIDIAMDSFLRERNAKKDCCVSTALLIIVSVDLSWLFVLLSTPSFLDDDDSLNRDFVDGVTVRNAVMFYSLIVSLLNALLPYVFRYMCSTRRFQADEMLLTVSLIFLSISSAFADDEFYSILVCLINVFTPMFAYLCCFSNRQN